MPRNDITTLKQAAEILHRNGRHATAEDCLHTAARLAVDATLGDTPPPRPGNRLERVVPRASRIGGAL